MTAADLERWEARWRERPGPTGAPEPFLEEEVGELPVGPVLDVASGDGRNALWLAGRGFEVTGVDIAPTAVARLRAAAGERALAVSAVAADLDAPGALAGLGPFAGLLVVRFKPTPPQWAALVAALRPGGRALLCSFRAAQHARNGFPLAYCLDRGELAALLEPRLQLLRWRDLDRQGEALAGSVWERPAGSAG